MELLSDDQVKDFLKNANVVELFEKFDEELPANRGDIKASMEDWEDDLMKGIVKIFEDDWSISKMIEHKQFFSLKKANYFGPWYFAR